MSRTAQLYDLQQVDTALDDRLGRVQTINNALGESEALREARRRRDAARQELAARQATLRQISAEVEDFSQRIAVMNKRLFDGSIKNPKELGQIQHEVEMMKQVRSAREDQLLLAMEQVDEAERIATQEEERCESAESDWRQSQSGLLEEKDRLDEQLKVLHTRREKMIAEVPWADLQLYEKLRRAKRGIAVAALVHDVCQGCRVQVPAGTLRQVRHGTEFTTCTSCGRLLHITGRGDLVTAK